MKKYVWLLLLLLTACDKNRVFEDYKNIPDHRWAIADTVKFEFEIGDSTQNYTLYYNVRNAVSYPNYNLFVKHTLTDTQGKVISARLQELMLMDATTGQPLGKGLGDIFDHQIISLPRQRFPHTGKYTFTIQQYMRQDPLPDIMSMGLRVEKEE
jgi:gliding motility-associated lipoprotein GldH